jgi:hypothetical protein
LKGIYFKGDAMDYETLMQLIVIFFWVSIGLSCLLAIIRGRVVTIKAFYPQLFLILLLGIGSVQLLVINISTNAIEDQVIPLIVLLICAITFLIAFPALRNQYIVWGMRESAFHEAIQEFLRKSNIGFKEEGNNQFILLQYPGDVYQHHSFNMITAGTILKITNKNRDKADQGSLDQKFMHEISEYSMNLSGKLLLIPIVLLSLFMLYVYFLIIR